MHMEERRLEANPEAMQVESLFRAFLIIFTFHTNYFDDENYILSFVHAMKLS